MFTPAHDKEKDWIYQGKELPPLHEDTVVVAKSKKRVADHVELGPGPSGGHHGQLERHTQVVQKNNYRHARRLHPSLELTRDVHDMKTLATRLGVKIPSGGQPRWISFGVQFLQLARTSECSPRRSARCATSHPSTVQSDH